jgi:hypothetical protein
LLGGFSSGDAGLLFRCVVGKIWFLQPSGLMMDGKPALCGVSPQPMFDQLPLDLVVHGEWLLRSSKAYMARAFAGVPTHYYQFSAIFNL